MPALMKELELLLEIVSVLVPVLMPEPAIAE